MIVLTNPGSNISSDHARRYNIVLTPQVISVDGVLHDTRSITSHAQVDEWVQTAKKHPFVLGTSAAEFVALFRDSGLRENEILAIMTSRHIIGSYDSAQAALRTLRSMPGAAKVAIHIVDSQATDVATGLITLFCAAAVKEGRSMQEILTAADKLIKGGRVTFVPLTIDYLVKGGRASFVKAWAADILKVSPMLSFIDGQIVNIGKVSRKTDISEPLVDELANRIGAGRPVWAAVSHGSNVVAALAVAARIRDRFDVRYIHVQPLAPPIYLHAGPGSVCVAVYPIDEIGWSPAPPEKA